jgi:hypothetical protein
MASVDANAHKSGVRTKDDSIQAKRGLQLDRVMLLGRTFEEYRRYLLLEPQELIEKIVLDVAGVSSFCAEANNLGIKATACDPIYFVSRERIMERSDPDLESVYRSIGLVPTYRWGFYDGEFDLTLVSYLLFAYQDRFDYEFHRDSILEIMRVTRA